MRNKSSEKQYFLLDHICLPFISTSKSNPDIQSLTKNVQTFTYLFFYQSCPLARRTSRRSLRPVAWRLSQVTFAQSQTRLLAIAAGQ